MGPAPRDIDEQPFAKHHLSVVVDPVDFPERVIAEFASA